MRDPHEGLTLDGMIKTGIRRDRVPFIFEPVIEKAIKEIEIAKKNLNLSIVSLYLYGSVATGTAIIQSSNVDLLTIGIPSDFAKHTASALSAQFGLICRGVEIAAANYEDFQTESDASYGGRIFLHHYCLHLHGCNLVHTEQSFAGDAKAARGFNGDIESHYTQWCSEMPKANPQELGRRIARKTLLAVAGLVSIHDHIWTTDRKSSALRWARLNVSWHTMIEKLMAWSVRY